MPGKHFVDGIRVSAEGVPGAECCIRLGDYTIDIERENRVYGMNSTRKTDKFDQILLLYSKLTHKTAANPVTTIL